MPLTELERLLEENRRIKQITPIGNKTTNYVWAIVILCTLGLAFVIGVLITRPMADNTSIIATGLGILIPVITGLLAGTIQQVHLAVNSRLTQLLALTAASSYAKGEANGLLQPSQSEAVSREEGKAAGVEQERVRVEDHNI